MKAFEDTRKDATEVASWVFGFGFKWLHELYGRPSPPVSSPSPALLLFLRFLLTLPITHAVKSETDDLQPLPQSGEIRLAVSFAYALRRMALHSFVLGANMAIGHSSPWLKTGLLKANLALPCIS